VPFVERIAQQSPKGGCYHRRVIVDFHTHIFSPEIVAAREDWCAKDRLFGALYADPSARLATAEDLLASMDASGIDVSVALGFAWTNLEHCTAHNDYLLEAAKKSHGRILPFCTIQPAHAPEEGGAEIARCAAAGARGLGELRPDDQGYSLSKMDSAAAVLVDAARQQELLLLFHVTEPVGHSYPGKQGFAMADFAAFAADSGVKCVGAHWGGGLPFFSLMPEVRRGLASTWFDTAASRFLYEPSVFSTVAGLVGVDRILFGSDFPLIDQAAARQEVEMAGLTPAATAAVLGGNAASLLGLA